MKRRSPIPAAFLSLPIFSSAAAEPAGVDFARDVKPILERSCLKCHGKDRQQGGLRFDHKDGALVSGDSGKKAIVPGRVDQSELVRRVEAAAPDERMPFKAEPLRPEEREVLRAWIEDGASWPENAGAAPAGRGEMAVTEEDRQHWSYLPLRVVDPPAVADGAWCRTPIDRFIRAALEARGIRPNPPAGRRTLIRRVYFDLIGLPPPPEEVEEFAADPSPEAHEELVDRLLESPHHGERWGRHWLDLARYADSGGMETDADRPNAYHYRDFVIRAFNDDLPYRTFVRWQLAGDEYEPDNPQALAATGLLTGAPNETLTDQHLEEERLRLRFNELDDMAVTSVSAFLGLTLGCARCHDHKFDAIPARDYYRIQCAFTTTARGDVFLAPRADVARYRKDETRFQERLQGAEARLTNWLQERQKPHTAALRNAKVDALPVGPDEKKLLKGEPDSDAARKLAKKHRKALEIPEEDYRRAFNEEERRKWDVLKEEIERIRREKPEPPPAALAITETKTVPQPTWLLERGDFYARKERLELGFLTVLTSGKTPLGHCGQK